MSLKALLADFGKAADPERAALLGRYFKTGKGGYAEGDKFLGLTVPAVRLLAKKHKALPLNAIEALLASPWHEQRLCSLLLLAEKFREGPPAVRKRIYQFYLRNTRFINNWDLVDLSAPRIVGGWLEDRSRKPLYRLAASKLLWERRIAVLACFWFIKDGESADALAIASRLLGDGQDLIHKAVGWMLRETGKRCSGKILLAFLEKHYPRLPRTTLRYAIEKFPPGRRKALLSGKF